MMGPSLSKDTQASKPSYFCQVRVGECYGTGRSLSPLVTSHDLPELLNLVDHPQLYILFYIIVIILSGDLTVWHLDSFIFTCALLIQILLYLMTNRDPRFYHVTPLLPVSWELDFTKRHFENLSFWECNVEVEGLLGRLNTLQTDFHAGPRTRDTLRVSPSAWKTTLFGLY